ncbi:flagellar basal body-associated FliL family protein [Paracoccus xiamenensis]|uniref:flagellar basal body-associated FliL family protein n=1 Tax=Paracoccus xiamenensis TaxID=2714901 RepID=UPI001409AFE3|nr:flagellar basal body-associated FliL family protein [Paracoccus xiamenensis]NHF73145.1 flagellar basal body protein FliL [Paracoccus xiamenensis]
MSETLAVEEPPAGSGRGKLVLAAGVLAAGLGGFAASYLGVVSPSALFAAKEQPADALPAVGFVDVPRIMVPLAGRDRQLVLSIKLECPPEKVAQVQLLMPRIADSFTSFLSDIQPAAIDRRGVLEIIRAELRARADMVLGGGVIDNILITEFAVQ